MKEICGLARYMAEQVIFMDEGVTAERGMPGSSSAVPGRSGETVPLPVR